MFILGSINEIIGLPELASEHGSMVDHMLEMVHWLIAVLLVGWTGFFVYCLWRFRKGKNPEADYHGVRGHASTHIEVGVVLVEAILLLGFAFPLWTARAGEYPEGPEVVRVRAVGEQFKWTMHYPGPDGKFGLTDAYLITSDNPLGLDAEDPNAADDFWDGTTLVIPQNQEVIVSVTSKDVIHNLHLPPMRVAQDAIPGVISDMWFRPTKTGRWETICGQLCGGNHAGMVGYMEVMTQEAYKEWTEGPRSKLQTAEPADTGEAAAADDAQSAEAQAS